MTDSRFPPGWMRSLLLAPPTLAAFALLVGACGDDGESITGPGATSCGPPPYLTVLPVPAANLVAVPVVGGVDAPGHTLPTDHGALFLDGTDVPLRSPADMTVTHLRRVRYSGPNEPPGAEDYAIFFQVCDAVGGWFGHVGSLASQFDGVEYSDCRSYSTPFTDVEACEANHVNLEVAAGELLGGGGPVIDMGMTDERVTNFYISPERWSGASHAVCMWEQFDAGNQAILFSRLKDGRRPGVVPTGEPRCGTMEVDVPGTAKGVWAEVGVTGPIQADETRYIALVDYPYLPEQELSLSLAPEALGATVTWVERRTSGRVNRAFEDVTPDGQVYCYGPEVDRFTGASWFLTLTSGTALTIERVPHAQPDASPCFDDPGTWSLGSGAVHMVR